MSEEHKIKLLQEACTLAKGVSDLLDECYLAHCKATGINP